MQSFVSLLSFLPLLAYKKHAFKDKLKHFLLAELLSNIASVPVNYIGLYLAAKKLIETGLRRGVEIND